MVSPHSLLARRRSELSPTNEDQMLTVMHPMYAGGAAGGSPGSEASLALNSMAARRQSKFMTELVHVVEEDMKQDRRKTHSRKPFESAIVEAIYVKMCKCKQNNGRHTCGSSLAPRT